MSGSGKSIKSQNNLPSDTFNFETEILNIDSISQNTDEEQKNFTTNKLIRISPLSSEISSWEYKESDEIHYSNEFSGGSRRTKIYSHQRNLSRRYDYREKLRARNNDRTINLNKNYKKSNKKPSTNITML